MRELKILQKGKDLIKQIYRLIKLLPSEERYVLINQLTRASISISLNIAEGQQRSDKDFIRFITISRGSIAEVNILLDICKDIYNINVDKEKESLEELSKMTYGLMLRLKAEVSK